MPVYRAGWVFWPLANMVNFLLVPPTGRVLYVNCAGLLWNTYLRFGPWGLCRASVLPMSSSCIQCFLFH